MRVLRKSLCVVLALLMLACVMVISPVTASAADGDTVTATVSKWIKGQLREGSALYKFDGLYDNINFVRVTKNQEGSWDNAIRNSNGQANQTDNLSLSGKGNTDTYQLQYWHNENGHMLGTWYDYDNVTDGIYLDAADRNGEVFAHADVDWYAYTYEEFTLTEHAATLTNVKYYTDSLDDGRYFIEDGTSYREADSSEVFFDYVTAGGTGVNLTEAISAGDGDTNAYGLGTGSLKNICSVGYQVKLDKSTLRFVSVLNTDVARDADDYGYVVAKTKLKTAAEAMAASGSIEIDNAKTVKKSCKETSNGICGDYGDYYADSAYKYVTLSVNELDEVDDTQWVVVTRFYVQKDGVTYYSKYDSYDGMAVKIADCLA